MINNDSSRTKRRTWKLWWKYGSNLSINGKDVYDIDAIGHCELENGNKCAILI